jgi:hypothetical protein
MSEQPKKSDDAWLGQAQADGWHMTEVGLSKRPDQWPWRKAILRRLVEIAAVGTGAMILPLVIDHSFVLPSSLQFVWRSAWRKR